MSRPRDEKGRFVRADDKPVLHRQVVDIDLSGITGDHIHGAEFECVPISLPAKPADPHGPRIELRTVVIGVLLLVGLVGAVFMGLAWLASPGGPGQ